MFAKNDLRGKTKALDQGFQADAEIAKVLCLLGQNSLLEDNPLIRAITPDSENAEKVL